VPRGEISITESVLIQLSYMRLHNAVMKTIKLAALREYKRDKLKFTFQNIKDLPLSIMQAPPDGINPFSCAPNLPQKMLSSMVPSNITSSMDSSYHIGGNLYLPNPETCRLNGEKLAWARELQPLLKQLDARDFSRESRNWS
jgi:hypothetical protein